MSNVFRLFISSTFDDFSKEREVLQSNVFPEIKRYCSSKHGASFQPIDLRWGVSSEAQLDQKTLELCLHEVQTCKTHPHPNFLIMLGDRYGWVPLPYLIEKKECEILLNMMNEEDKALVLSWYSVDENQLPSSYRLKERSEAFTEYAVWKNIEEQLRTLLQHTVATSSLNEFQKRKYFLSATEAEVEEGIIPYCAPTPFQQALLSNNPLLAEMDPQHVFGFLRDIDVASQKSKKFIVNDEDYTKAQLFKTALSETLLEEITLHVKTTERDSEHLDESYLLTFQERITAFLKAQVDTFLSQQTTHTLSSLEKEKAAQTDFLDTKRKGYLATPQLDNLAQSIDCYTNNAQEDTPFVLHGASGTGKSSLMAQAIIKAQASCLATVLYRFVGATPDSSSSKAIWISLFEELGMDIRSEKEKRTEEEKSLHVSQDDETFEQFSERLHMHIMSLTQDVVIFIDAIDQIGHSDTFLWLPKTLPLHVKIIISTLKDSNYAEDSAYLKSLELKSNHLQEIPLYSEPLSLLHALLSKEHRTLTESQETYFLEQYAYAKTPLYISIAAQEMKHWRSSAVDYKLAQSNQTIIEDFITNLTKLYHHDKDFVHKVLGYIIASRDGLSENELLSLFATDEAFIKMMAPEKFHKNLTNELPIVIWSRFFAQLKAFFRYEQKDNELLLSFFHREFQAVIAKLPHQQQEHEKAIEAVQKRILTAQYDSFASNRLGKLYAILITEYALQYEKEQEKFKAYAQFIASLKDEEWVEAFLRDMNKISVGHSTYNRMKPAFAFGEALLYATELLGDINPRIWTYYNIISLNNLATFYLKINNLDKATNLLKKAFDITKKTYSNNNQSWTKIYICILDNLASSYLKINNFDKAKELYKEGLAIVEKLYDSNNECWVEDYMRALNNLGHFYYEERNFNKSIELFEIVLSILEKYYSTNHGFMEEIKFKTLNNLASSYLKINNFDKTIELFEIVLGIKKNSLKIILYDGQRITF